MLKSTTQPNRLLIPPLHDQSTFPKWSRTVRLALHKHGRTRYIATNYTELIKAVNKHDARQTSAIFTDLDINIDVNHIFISSDSLFASNPVTVKTKSLDSKGKKKENPLDDDASLKLAREICKGRHKTFVFLCSMVAPELLEDITSMSNGCPHALWATINNRYGINDTVRQLARRSLSSPETHLLCPGDTVCSIWACIQGLVDIMATETNGQKISECSWLVILAAALRGLSTNFNGQFNALPNTTPTKTILRALNHIELSLQDGSSSARPVVLYVSQSPPTQGPRSPHQHPPQPNSACTQHLTSVDRSRFCSFHNMHGHTLTECHEAAQQGATPRGSHHTALAAMTAAAVAATAGLPTHAPQSAVLAAMTAAAASARPHNFTITSAHDSNHNTNKPLPIYTALSIVAPVHLPTIANTGATQHTTNQRNLLHNFIPMHTPSQLICANRSHIECVSHGTMCGTVTIDGAASPVTIWGC